ncbi:MAG: hypothetical protein JNK65_04975, partial [Deltaproteobacteria bacterium]|nr:hypothetical protein [Deltaproteobacteria bacterium]
MKKILSQFCALALVSAVGMGVAYSNSSAPINLEQLGKLSQLKGCWGAKVTVYDVSPAGDALLVKMRIDEKFSGDVTAGEMKTVKFPNPAGGGVVTRTMMGVNEANFTPGEVFIGFFTENAMGFTRLINGEKFYMTSNNQ